MVRREPPSRSESDRSQSKQANALVRRRVVDFDIYQDLDLLQEMIIEGFHIPLTRWTVIDEAKLLDQLERIGERVPEAIQRALSILDQEEDILVSAENHAQNLVQSAQQRAAQILDETGIIQQAERQASQIRQQVQQECEAVQQQTLRELEQMRQAATQELQQFRQQTLGECEATQAGADEYADAVLTRLEQQLGDMLKVVRNGRQQLYDNSPSLNSVTKRASDSPSRSKKKPES